MNIGRIPSVLPEIQTFQNNVATVGGSVSMETLQALDRFVRDCYNAGIWTKLTEVYPIVGANLATAMVKLKYVSVSTLTAVNLVGADYNERGANGGIAGDGSTKYLNTSLSLQQLTANSGHFAAYMREVETTTPRYWMGANSATDFYLLGMPASNPNTFWGGSAQQALDISPATLGLYQGERLNANSLNLYLNGSLRAANNNAVAPVLPNHNVLLLCRNNAGAPVQFTAKRFGFFSIGATMSDAERLAYYNAVQALQTHLQRNV